MVKFSVDGLSYNDPQQAFIVAERLYGRYDGFRTIEVVQHNEDGTQHAALTLEANKFNTEESTENQQELF